MKKNNLFELIQSMSKSEKRHFKLSSSRFSEKEKKYVKMFDVINDQKAYNEKEVKTQLKKLIHEKNFAVEKNYLYNYLLKSLTAYHHQKSLNSKASNSLYTIRVLIDKALYSQAKNLIEKSQLFAEKSENYTLLLEILKLKINYYETIVDNDGINQTYDYLFEVQGIYTNLETLRYLHHKIYELLTQLGKTSREDLIKSADDLIKKHDILQSEQNCLSNEGKIRFNEFWFLHHYLNNNIESAYQNSKRSVELSENTPYYTTEKKDNYISNLNNYMICCTSLKFFEEANAQIEKLKGFVSKDSNSRSNINIFISTALQETSILMITNQQEQIYDSLSYYEEYINLFEDKLILSYTYGLYINMALCLFVQNDFKLSLKYINNIINGSIPKTRIDVVGFSWLFNLVLHYELENYDYLEYLVQSTNNQLQKLNQFTVTSKILGKHLLKLSEGTGPKTNGYNELLNELKKEGALNEVEEAGFFDLELWVRSKLEDKPLKMLLDLS